MFVRVKSTKNSPRKSVQIVESHRIGSKVSQKIVHHVGVAENDEALERLKQLAKSMLDNMNNNKNQDTKQNSLFAQIDETEVEINEGKDLLVNLKNIEEEARIINGIQDIYGKLFDEFELDKVMESNKISMKNTNILKNIVLARIAQPMSKRSSVSYIEEHFGIKISLNSVYKMMDKLDDNAIEKLNKNIYLKTKELFEEKINVVFFDCTTLYFETFTEDKLRKNGFSKENKHHQAQVVIAMMVTKEGLPIGYECFSGNTYEGNTLPNAIERLRKKYEIEKIIFVADAGLLSDKNVKIIEEKPNWEYIMGYRIKNSTREIKKQILDLSKYQPLNNNENGDKVVLEIKIGNQRIIVTHSKKKAKKDLYEREKMLEKLRNKITNTTKVKSFIEKKLTSKYIKIIEDTSVEIDEEKVQEAKLWDGLHGIVSNNQELSVQELLTQYTNLYHVENAFRINKHNLKIRPIFHFNEARIKAHLAISFMAFSMVKHLEYRLKMLKMQYSIEKIKELLLSVQTSILFDKTTKCRYALMSKMPSDVRKIYQMFNIKYSKTPYQII